MGMLMGGLYYQSGVEKGLNYYGLFLNTIMLLSVRGGAGLCSQTPPSIVPPRSV